MTLSQVEQGKGGTGWQYVSGKQTSWLPSSTNWLIYLFQSINLDHLDEYDRHLCDDEEGWLAGRI